MAATAVRTDAGDVCETWNYERATGGGYERFLPPPPSESQPTETRGTLFIDESKRLLTGGAHVSLCPTTCPSVCLSACVRASALLLSQYCGG